MGSLWVRLRRRGPGGTRMLGFFLGVVVGVVAANVGVVWLGYLASDHRGRDHIW